MSRLRAELLERGDYDWAFAFAEHIRDVRARGEVSPPRWEEGALVADVTLELVRGDGEPLLLV